MQSNGIIELRDDQNLAFILDSTDMFFATGYKVLQNQGESGFIRCSKVLYNGKPKLIYNISSYKSLDTLLDLLNPETFMNIFRNLIDIVIEVKNNGFMQCENIYLSFDKIFVDCSTYKVYLIYLPIDTPKKSDSYVRFEYQLKNSVLNIINTNTNLQSQNVINLCEKFKEPVYPIEQIRSLFKENSTQDNKQIEENVPTPVEPIQLYIPEVKKKGLFSKINNKVKKQNKTASSIMMSSETEILEELLTPHILLSGLNTSVKIEIEIDKAEFLIGKKAESVDGAVSFNNAISRIHCKIIYVDGKYFIMDMNSANGTFVNGIKVCENQKAPITIGDNIRLANSDFIIKAI